MKMEYKILDNAMKNRFFAILLCLISVMTICVFPVTVSTEEVIS